MNYDLELNKVVQEIKKNKAKLVCIQLPDGLKPKAQEIVDHLTKETKARVLIWLGSSYGACDIPLELKNIKVDLLLSWGHAAFRKEW